MLSRAPHRQGRSLGAAAWSAFIYRWGPHGAPLDNAEQVGPGRKGYVRVESSLCGAAEPSAFAHHLGGEPSPVDHASAAAHVL